MASVEIAPLSKHMTPILINITSAKMIMILPAFVYLWVNFKKSCKYILMKCSGKAGNETRTNLLDFGSDPNHCLDTVHHQRNLIFVVSGVTMDPPPHCPPPPFDFCLCTINVMAKNIIAMPSSSSSLPPPPAQTKVWPSLCEPLKNKERKNQLCH